MVFPNIPSHQPPKLSIQEELVYWSMDNLLNSVHYMHYSSLHTLLNIVIFDWTVYSVGPGWPTFGYCPIYLEEPSQELFRVRLKRHKWTLPGQNMMLLSWEIMARYAFYIILGCSIKVQGHCIVLAYRNKDPTTFIFYNLKWGENINFFDFFAQIFPYQPYSGVFEKKIKRVSFLKLFTLFQIK